MQLVSLYNPAATQYRNNNYRPAFTGVEDKAVKVAEEVFSEKSKNLVKKLDQVFDEQYAIIKKKRLRSRRPLVATTTRRGIEVRVEPLDFIDRNLIHMSLTSKDRTDKFIFDRRNIEHFRYEHQVPTKYGYTVVKSMDYHREHDIEVSRKLNDAIEKYFPTLIKNK